MKKILFILSVFVFQILFYSASFASFKVDLLKKHMAEARYDFDNNLFSLFDFEMKKIREIIKTQFPPQKAQKALGILEEYINSDTSNESLESVFQKILRILK